MARITGVRSDEFDLLAREIEQIKANAPRFEFVRPSDEDIRRRRSILSESYSVREAKKLIEQIAKDDPDAIESLREQLEMFSRKNG